MKHSALLAAAIGAFVLVGCRVSEPGKFERAVARNLKQRITVGGKKDVNPLSATPEIIHQGQERFASYCFVCHGLDAQNTGVPFAERMSPPVPELTSSDVQGYSDGQLKWIIENGVSPSGMPASRGILSDDEIWSLVVYIRHLPAKGSLGEPSVYSGDQQQHPPSPKTALPDR